MAFEKPAAADRGKQTGITPAALSALAKGDTFNAAVALSPGGIEAQEAAGQKVFAVAETLPTKGLSEFAAKLTALGFVIGEPVENDPIFTRVTLPPGWKKAPTSHSMWTDLVDDRGRKRAGLFYKAAFYDRSAHICWNRAVNYTARTVDGRDEYSVSGDVPVEMVGIVALAEQEIHRTEPVSAATQRERWRVADTLRDQARAWIAEHYPDHEDPFAYWP